MGTERVIILLASEALGPSLRDFLLGLNPCLRIETPRTLEALRAVIARTGGRARILSFLNDLIIPADILGALKMTPYNIHPGPPEYRGPHPVSFAIWDGAARYGVTAHEMVARVDEGRIVALSRFDAPPLADRKTLSDLTMREAIKLFAVIADWCARHDGAMAPMAERWSGAKHTKSQFRALCRSYAVTPPADRDRLRRACGEDLEGAAAA